MASPFYLFRKYQRAFIAIAAVVAMFIFCGRRSADELAAILQRRASSQRKRGGNNVEWRGAINAQQLGSLVERRAKISNFLDLLHRTAAAMVEQEGGTAVPPALPDLRLRDNRFVAIQEACISDHIFADLAKDSGISVSDDFINHYLREWGLRRVGDAEMTAFLNRVGLSQKALFSGLRELLMSSFYFSTYDMTIGGIREGTVWIGGVTPEEKWQDWKQLNERIALQVAVLPTDSFISEVADPG